MSVHVRLILYLPRVRSISFPNPWTDLFVFEFTIVHITLTSIERHYEHRSKPTLTMEKGYVS